jgi:pSer/pThr/pTyr-binding forkhead associated (FHA) protein
MNRQSARDTEDEPMIQTVAEPLQQHLAAQHKEPVAPTVRRDAPMPYRPANRQPMALLTVLDDGSRDEGEAIRIRDSKFVIGREKGDLQIPFDADMSGYHAELRCQKPKGRFRWFLIDRKSTNGTFVRAVRASLSRESELIIGGRRYLFQLPEPGKGVADTDALQTQAYRAPSRTMLEQFVPQLVEMGVPDENARTFSIGGETYIGGDPRCQITIQDDPFINPKHARLYQDETERWMIEDQKSLNGVWIRVNKFAMDKPTEFQLGQQRFLFRPAIA